MLIDRSQEITFIHGWLFGPYIWNDVRKYFNQIKKHNVISLSSFDLKTSCSNKEKINDLLKSVGEDQIILSYSYSASLILYSDNLNICKGTIILINPFFKPKENSINYLYNNIKADFKKNIRRFIYNCVKREETNSKSNYQRLLKLFENNYIPSTDLLCLDLKDLDKINQSDRLVKPIKNLHIIQSSSDEVNDTSMFNLLESSKFNTYQLANSSHFPFFEFDQIYEIIKNIK